MSILSRANKRLLWVTVFGVAFGFLESSVVVYLRALYYPEGFSFPLKLMSAHHLSVELAREGSTLVMLVAVGALAGTKVWERFAYFLVAFGVWDIFYYVWLKAASGWPSTPYDWDILFLIPLPWIGPVIAPVAISLLMIVCGVIIVFRLERNRTFDPHRLSWPLASVGTAALLYSFMRDTQATLHGQLPEAYSYGFFFGSLILYISSFILACRPSFRQPTTHE